MAEHTTLTGHDILSEMDATGLLLHGAQFGGLHELVGEDGKKQRPEPELMEQNGRGKRVELRG